MAHHIVMWKFRPEIPEEKKPELTVDFVENPMASSTHDVALVTTLEKAEDIAAYGVHPEHVKVADTYVRPYVTERACLDYE